MMPDVRLKVVGLFLIAIDKIVALHYAFSWWLNSLSLKWIFPYHVSKGECESVLSASLFNST